jgi:tetratricopeptide (TPR) repeat protein
MFTLAIFDSLPLSIARLLLATGRNEIDCQIGQPIDGPLLRAYEYHSGISRRSSEDDSAKSESYTQEDGTELLSQKAFGLILFRKFEEASEVIRLWADGADSDCKTPDQILLAKACLNVTRHKPNVPRKIWFDTQKVFAEAIKVTSSSRNLQLMMESLIGHIRIVGWQGSTSDDEKLLLTAELSKLVEFVDAFSSSDRYLSVRVAQCSGYVAMSKENYLLAKEKFSEALNVLEGIKEDLGWYKSELLLELSNACSRLKEYADAQMHLSQAIDTEVHGAGDSLRLAKLFASLGMNVHLTEGSGHAETHFLKALDFYERFPGEFTYEKLSVLHEIMHGNRNVMPPDRSEMLESKIQSLIEESKKFD